MSDLESRRLTDDSRPETFVSRRCELLSPTSPSIQKGCPVIRNLLLEMNLFDAAKETDNKLCWDAVVEGTTFSLYITFPRNRRIVFSIAPVARTQPNQPSTQNLR